ncbi:hypothetical protein [Parapedobacter indicus]|nr:hypothetical protein [Parapedobacter indicus]
MEWTFEGEWLFVLQYISVRRGIGLEGSGSREQQSMCRSLRISKKQAD